MNSIHASAVLIGATAALIRGPSGAGKSRLAWALLEAGRSGALPFARLVGDDRVHADARGGRLLVRPAATLAGLIELHDLGIRMIVHEPIAVVGLVIDLAAGDGVRLPPAEARQTVIAGVSLPRLAVAPGTEPLPLVLAYLRTVTGGD